MSHKTIYIECDEREAEAIRTATKYLFVLKLGRGREVRQMFEGADFSAHEAEMANLCREHGKAAMVYAYGVVNQLDLTALYGTYNPHTDHWKIAEAAVTDLRDLEL